MLCILIQEFYDSILKNMLIDEKLDSWVITRHLCADDWLTDNSCRCWWVCSLRRTIPSYAYNYSTGSSAFSLRQIYVRKFKLLRKDTYTYVHVYAQHTDTCHARLVSSSSSRGTIVHYLRPATTPPNTQRSYRRNYDTHCKYSVQTQFHPPRAQLNQSFKSERVLESYNSNR